MDGNKKAAGLPRAASKTFCDHNHSPMPSRVKAAVVRLALRGLLPVKAADWIILRGGLRDV